MLSVTSTRKPVSTLTPAPAVPALERSAKEMKLRVIVILVFGAITSLSCGGDAPPTKPLQMNVAEVYDFVVSLMELRESTQHKRFDADELKTIATALAASKFLKKMEHEDIARTPYISRYQFTHGFLGGTPRTGENESGMLTIDCRRFYWGHAIFEIDANNAAKLQKLFPTPKNALTKSELPNFRPEDKQAEQNGCRQRLVWHLLCQQRPPLAVA